MITDTYSQPDAPDPVLSDERVLELVRRHVPSARRVTGVDESGGEARAYMCDGDLVLKTQRPQQLRARTSLEKEALILEELARQIAAPIPRVLGYGREDDAEYVLMTRIPGVSLQQAALVGATRVAVLEAVGATLRKIHEIDQRAMEASGLIPGDQGPGDLHGRLASMFDSSIEALDPMDASDHGVERRWADDVDLRSIRRWCLSGLPVDTPPVALHSNPGPEHCFVDPDTSRLSGLIDFGDAYRSHPALDVRSWRSPEDSMHMLAGYRAAGPLPDGFEHVWRAGLIVTELRVAARGHREPRAAAATVAEIVRGAPDPPPR
jgi:aminoglycoside phosphotransferase (APT) family kinase protein